MAENSLIWNFIARDKASKVVNSLREKIGSLGHTIAAGLGRAAEVGVIALGAAMVRGVVGATSLQKSMERLHTQAGVSQSSIGGLTNSVLDLSGKVGVSASQLSDGLYHVESSFASTGITGKRAMELLQISAEGARVGNANLVDVTNALDAAVVSGIPGVKDLSGAMGVLNATVGAGDMSMQDLADAMGGGVLAVVKGFGLSILDVGAALAVFGDNNIRGAEAGTMLRMSVQAMTQPVKTAGSVLARLGLTQSTLARDMQKGGLNLALKDLVDRMKKAGVTSQEQGQIITELFGKKAGSGVNVLVSQFDRLQSKYVDLAKGSNTFGKSWDALQGTFDQAKARFLAGLDSILIKLGMGLLPELTKLANWAGTELPVAFGYAQRAVSAFWTGLKGGGSKDPSSIMQKLAIAGGAVRVSFEALLTIGRGLLSFYKDHSTIIQGAIVITLAMVAANRLIAGTYAVLRGVTIAYVAVQEALNVVMSANPISLVIVALAGLVAGLIFAYKHSDTFRSIVDNAFRVVKADFLQLVATTKPLWEAFARLGVAAKNLWDSLKPVRDWIVSNLMPPLKMLASVSIAVLIVAFKAFAAIIRTVVWPVIVFIISKFVDFVAATVKVITAVVNMTAGIVNTIRNAYGRVSGVISGLIRIIKDPFGAAKNWLVQPAIDMIEGLGRGILQKAKDIGGWIKDIGGKILNGIKSFFGIHSPSTVMAGIGGNLLQGLMNGLSSSNPLDIAKKVFGGLPQALGSMVSSGFIKAQQLSSKAMSALGSAWNAGSKDISFPGGLPGGVVKWVGVASQALQLAGAPQGWLFSLLMRMNRESGGNPFAINLTDSNAAAGDPSRGLMQTIGSTFAAYAGPFVGRGIYDPLANIYAAIKYTIARYGTGPAGWNRPGGYDTGGMVMPGWTPIYNGTGRPEHMFTDRNYDQIAKRLGGSGTTIIFQHSGTLIGDNVDDWMTRKIDMLKRQKRI